MTVSLIFMTYILRISR